MRNQLLALQHYLKGKKTRSGLVPSQFPEVFDLSYIEDLDFTVICDKLPEVRELKGRKVSQKYVLPENENIVVAEKFFEDIFDPKGNLINIKIRFVWYYWRYYSKDAKSWSELEIGHEKIKTVKINRGRRANILRNRRIYAITDLQASAQGTPVEDKVDLLLKHYKEVKDLYIDNSTKDFKLAIQMEKNPIIVDVLNTIANPVSGYTVKQSILERI